MKEQLLRLKHERAKLITDARKIMEQAQNEKRSRRAEEIEQFDKIMQRADELKKEIDDMDRMIRMDEDTADPGREIPPANIDPAKGDEDDKETNSKKRHRFNATKEYRAAFSSYLRTGRVTNAEEARALSAGDGTEGGFLIAPQEFANQLIKFVDDNVFVRQYAVIHTLKQVASIGVPSLDTDMSDAEWTTELATGSLDTDMAFGKRELRPYPFAKRAKVSRSLINLSSMGVEKIVLDRLGYKFGVTEEKQFLTGNGSSKPLGMFVASNAGIPTSRDRAFTSATEIDADALISGFYDLKEQYRQKDSLCWIYHRSFARRVALLKDGEGRYLFDIKDETLLGKKVHQSEFAPSTFTAGQYTAILGDMSMYHIAQVEDVEVQRLEELYAETNQIGFIGRRHADGMPALAEAFVRFKMG